MTYRAIAFPEGLDYPDTGCEAGGPSCLACRLPTCVLDDPGGLVRAERQGRAAQMAARAAAGASIGEIMREFGLSRRSVFRILNGR